MSAVADLTARRLAARVAATQVSGRLPSIAAGVVRDGELVWSGGYGDVPGNHLDVQYRIGSITKTMTAVLVLQLVAEGRLDLASPASDVLGDVGYADRSIRSLLAHNSGMQSEPVGSWWERSAGGTFEHLVAANDGSRGVFTPGHRFHYSNLGYALLGELVARLREQTWWECVQSRILTPLGMDRTSYLPVEPAAQGFSVHPYAGTLSEEPATDTGAMAPAGQVWSTIGDLATYAGFVMAGHPDVLARQRLLSATAPQSGAEEDGLEYAHGLGFQMFAGGSGTIVGHSGSMPGFVASCFVDHPRRTGFVALTNGTTGLPAAGLAISVLEELEASEPTLPAPWTPTAAVPAEVAGVLGVWHWGNTAYTFSLEGEEVVARRAGEEQYRFESRAGRIIGTSGYHAGEELHVVRNADGTVNHLNVATFIFTRVPYDPSAPIPGPTTRQ